MSEELCKRLEYAVSIGECTSVASDAAVRIRQLAERLEREGHINLRLVTANMRLSEQKRTQAEEIKRLKSILSHIAEIATPHAADPKTSSAQWACEQILRVARPEPRP